MSIFWRYVWRTLALLSLLVVFLVPRLWWLEERYFFYGDTGRDFWVLADWVQTGKPPLLGPQTSALPFNQSAWYFYLLLPGFLLAPHNLAMTSYLAVIVHVVGFGGLWWWLNRHRSNLVWPVWLIGLLLAIHPQMILQHRMVWNPSFVSLLLVIGVTLGLVWRESLHSHTHSLRSWLAYEEWLPHSSAWLLRFGSFALALAIGMSYSAAPAVVLWLLVVGWKQRQAWRWWVNFLGSLVLVFAPMGFFELRHGFVLTKMMLFQEKIPQQGTELWAKLQNLDLFVVAAKQSWQTGLVVGMLGLALAWAYWWLKSHSVQWPLVCVWRLVTLWAGLVLVSYLVLPVGVQAHYIFPLLTAGVMVVSLLPHWSKWLVVAIVAMVWQQPTWWQRYLEVPVRTNQQSLACAAAVCQTVTEPVYVSVQGYYPYHNGIEFQYLLRQAGCSVKKLDNPQDQANLMAVFVEDSVYEHGKTSYNELTQFGPSVAVQRLECTPKLSVEIVRKR